MSWKIKIEELAQKKLDKLNKSLKTQIIKYFDKIIESNENPRSFGKPLTANKAGLWRYRIGNYRVICQIKDNELIILVLDVDHRAEIYK